MLAHGLELSSKFPVTNNYPVTKNYLVRFFVNLKRKKKQVLLFQQKVLGRAQIAIINPPFCGDTFDLRKIEARLYLLIL